MAKNHQKFAKPGTPSPSGPNHAIIRGCGWKATLLHQFGDCSALRRGVESSRIVGLWFCLVLLVFLGLQKPQQKQVPFVNFCFKKPQQKYKKHWFHSWNGLGSAQDFYKISQKHPNTSSKHQLQTPVFPLRPSVSKLRITEGAKLSPRLGLSNMNK